MVPIDAAPSSKARGAATGRSAARGSAPSDARRAGRGSSGSGGKGGGSSGSGGKGSGSGGGRSRPALTSRAAILALVICVIALSLAYPLREYLAQRARIAELREEQAQTEQAVADLRERREELRDPAYIEREARTRLHYQYPGERAYVVVSDEDDQGADGGADSGEPWFDRLWKSVLEADKPKEERTVPEAEPTD
ncbi:FtsB family cell division protein [Streptomonospora litoralis]|uniref:FtsB family cell division protein n=1 Tax=Streptomonospora litoralis TaxID=2498135 RepID=UPI001F61891A|nr:septum formation initiator family protein [Streptomonospora litoralis]